MEKHEIKKLIKDANSGRKTVDEVVDLIFEDMGRGSRIFVVDENLIGLDNELGRLNYTVYTLPKGLNDDEVKRKITGRVLVTANGGHFVADVANLHYGLVWVLHSGDYKVLAKKIEKALMAMKTNFRRSVEQVIKV